MVMTKGRAWVHRYVVAAPTPLMEQEGEEELVVVVRQRWRCAAVGLHMVGGALARPRHPDVG